MKKFFRMLVVFSSVCLVLITPSPFFKNLSDGFTGLSVVCGSLFLVSLAVLFVTKRSTYKELKDFFILCVNRLDPFMEK